MNIFVSDANPYVAALNLPNKLFPKMLLESTQILSTALRLNGCTDESLYKASHVRHQSVTSVARSYVNFEWLACHAMSIGDLYYETRKTHHKSYGTLIRCIDLSDLVPRTTSTMDIEPACSSFNDGSDTVVDKYRKFMVNDKALMLGWSVYGNCRPEWWQADLFDDDTAYAMHLKRMKRHKKPVFLERSEFLDEAYRLLDCAT